MKTFVVGTFVVLGTLMGCGNPESPKDTETFSFEIREEPADTFAQLPIELVVTTENQSPCLTHALKGDVGFGSDVVAVSLTSIPLPTDVCIPSNGPAEFRYPLGFGPARVDNPFYLTFQRGGDLDRYLIIVSATEIDIAPLQVRFTRPLARRIPRS